MIIKVKKARVYKLNIGDLVEVKSKEEVSETLDPMNKLDGCLFMNQMWGFCGKELEVIKVVKNIFDEHQCKMYKTSAPLYILDGAICDGNVDSFEQTCDHSCYLLWHEDWLLKVN